MGMSKDEGILKLWFPYWALSFLCMLQFQETSPISLDSGHHLRTGTPPPIPTHRYIEKKDTTVVQIKNSWSRKINREHPSTNWCLSLITSKTWEAPTYDALAIPTPSKQGNVDEFEGLDG